MKLLILAAIFLSHSDGKVPDTPILLSDEQIRSGLDPAGNCEGSGQSIDMHRVMFLENKTIDVSSPKGPLRLFFRGENFYAREVGQNSAHSLHYVDVDAEIDEDNDLDIQLRFAYLDGSLKVYWKETFQNRIYRQGLFNVVGHELRSLCEGQGGSRTEP